MNTVSERSFEKALDKIRSLSHINAELLKSLERLVLAFDVGDMQHTSLNGRGYAALAESREAISKAKGE